LLGFGGEEGRFDWRVERCVCWCGLSGWRVERERFCG